MAVKKKKAPRWAFTYESNDYVIDVGRDLTFSRMRHIKQWFPQLGSINQVVIGLVNGDPEAWACAIWAARKAAGETDVPEPHRMKDFPIWDLMADDDVDGEDDEDGSGVDGERPTSSQTTGSTKTSSISEPDISAS